MSEQYSYYMYTNASCAAFLFVLNAIYAATTKTFKLNTVALKIISHTQNKII